MRKGFIPIPIVITGVFVLVLLAGIGLMNIKIEGSQVKTGDSRPFAGFGSLPRLGPAPSSSPAVVSSPSGSSTWRVISTPSPTASTSTSSNSFTNSNSNPTPTPVPTPTPAFHLDSISPSSGKAGDQITLRGVGFGNVSGGQVVFETSTSGGCCGAYADSWSDGEIKVKISTFGAKGTKEVSVLKPNGQKSNSIAFEVTAGQPYIGSYSPNPMTNIQSPLTINGAEFGSSTGRVDFYYNSSKIGNCNSSSWSDSQIVCYVNMSYPGDYGLQVTTSDGRQSSFKYLTLSTP